LTPALGRTTKPRDDAYLAITDVISPPAPVTLPRVQADPRDRRLADRRSEVSSSAASTPRTDSPRNNEQMISDSSA
jgi:hypothetical protein